VGAGNLKSQYVLNVRIIFINYITNRGRGEGRQKQKPKCPAV
jgi:hypothetical protein